MLVKTQAPSCWKQAGGVASPWRIAGRVGFTGTSNIALLQAITLSIQQPDLANTEILQFGLYLGPVADHYPG